MLVLYSFFFHSTSFGLIWIKIPIILFVTWNQRSILIVLRVSVNYLEFGKTVGLSNNIISFALDSPLVNFTSNS